MSWGNPRKDTGKLGQRRRKKGVFARAVTATGRLWSSVVVMKEPNYMQMITEI